MFIIIIIFCDTVLEQYRLIMTLMYDIYVGLQLTGSSRSTQLTKLNLHS